MGAPEGKFVVVVLEGRRPSGGSRSIAGRFKLPGEPSGVYIVDRIRRGAIPNLIFRVDGSSDLYLVAYDVKGDWTAAIGLRQSLERSGCGRLARSVYICPDPSVRSLAAQSGQVNVLVLPVRPLRPEDDEVVRQALEAARPRPRRGEVA